MRQLLQEMRMFSVVWIGQLVSIVGTGMTQFALAIWVWEQTGAVIPMVLLGVVSTVASLAAGLVAGPLVDRWNRQRVMMVSDVIAGVGSLAIFVLYTSGALQVWHLYVISGFLAVARVFQSLAYQAAITMMLPAHQYARASGLNGIAHYASVVLAPLLGGVLLSLIGFGGILLVDLASFLFGVSVLFLVRIPQPPAQPVDERKALWRDTLSGFQVIMRRPGLVGLLLIALCFTTAESLGYPLITPMILARTGGDEALLGVVRAAQGIGGIAGAVLLSVWGGPRKRIHGVLIGVLLTGLLGDMLMGLGQNMLVWIIAGIGLEVFIPVILGSYQAIWQTQIPPEMQGRVFAARDVISTGGEPVAMLFSGLLVDNTIEPAMQPGGSLAPIFAPLVGSGAGAGMSLMLVICGVFCALVALVGYLFPAVREVEAAPESIKT